MMNVGIKVIGSRSGVAQRQAADLAFRVADLRLFPSKAASLALSQIKQYARC